MKPRADKKIFQAVSDSTVVKRFIMPSDLVPDGWFLTQQEALQAFGQVPQKEEPVAEEVEAPRRGRPRKA